jgi:four helix bundle protein
MRPCSDDAVLSGMGDFKKLLVWEKAHTLAVKVQRLANRTRQSDLASLRHQMLRASASIPTNIVEGSRQSSRREFERFLRYSLNSASELEYHLILARDIGASPEAECSTLIENVTEVRKMLHGLLRRVTTAKDSKGRAPAVKTPV